MELLHMKKIIVLQMKKMSDSRFERLAHIGVGGLKSWIYSVNGCSPTLPAQYKDSIKGIISARNN